MTKGRRGWGEDSVYQDGDRWRGAISLGRVPDGRRRRIKVSGGTKAEVIAKLKEVHRALDAGLESPTRRLTVGAYLDQWIEGVPGRVEQSTASDYADTVRLHLKPGLGSKILTKLSVSELSALWASKRKAGYSANSIRIMRTVLRSALHQAEREGLLVRNVAALSVPPRIGQSEGRSHKIAEARRLLDATNGDRSEALHARSCWCLGSGVARHWASPGRTSISTQDWCIYGNSYAASDCQPISRRRRAGRRSSSSGT